MRFQRLIIVCVLVSPALGVGALAAGATGAEHEPRHARASGPSTPGSVRPAYVPDELLVRYRTKATDHQRAQVRSKEAVTLQRQLADSQVEVVSLPSGASVRAAVRKLERHRSVAYAEPNYYFYARATPNDPRFVDGTTWSLRTSALAGIDAERAWDITTGSRSVTVGILDSGLAFDHPDMQSAAGAGNVANPGERGLDAVGRSRSSNGHDDDGNGKVDDSVGWDFVDDDNTPYDRFGEHGTHVAGTIGALGNNAYGMSGVNWQVSMLPIRVLTADGGGTSADIIAGIDYARRTGIDVVNVSLGAAYYSAAVHEALRRARGVLFVAAADNAGDNSDRTPDYPCSLTLANVICVAASTRSDELAEFSSYGRASVDLAAPGADIYSTVPRWLWDDDFGQSIAGRWVAGSATSAPSRWARIRDRFGTALTDSPPGSAPYKARTNTWIRTARPIDITGRRDCALYFTLERYLDRSGADKLYVERRLVRDGSAGPWQRVGKPFTRQGYEGVERPITSAAGATGVYIRFRLRTDARVNRDGVYIDDVRVHCFPSQYADAFRRREGTSMATPHVTGVAALVFAARQGASVGLVKRAIIEGVDVKESGNGIFKTVSHGRLNAYGALRQALGALQPLAIRQSAPGATGGTTQRRPRFAWRAWKPPAGVATYRVYIDGVAGPVVPGATTTYRPRNPLRVGYHNWFVVGRDRTGATARSTIRGLVIRTVPKLELWQEKESCGSAANPCVYRRAGTKVFAGGVTPVSFSEQARVSVLFYRRGSAWPRRPTIVRRTRVTDGFFFARLPGGTSAPGEWRVSARIAPSDVLTGALLPKRRLQYFIVR